MENREPLSLVAQALGIPWWAFALASQVLVIAAVLVFLAGLHRWQTAPGVRFLKRWHPLPDQLVTVGLPLAAGLFVAACGIYCYAWWPKPPAPRILEPDGSILCWLYCGVFMTWPWAAATVFNGLVMCAAGLLLGVRRSEWCAWLAIVAGAVAFPVGLLSFYAGWYALRGRDWRSSLGALKPL